MVQLKFFKRAGYPLSIFWDFSKGRKSQQGLLLEIRNPHTRLYWWEVPSIFEELVPYELTIIDVLHFMDVIKSQSSAILPPEYYFGNNSLIKLIEETYLVH